MALVTGSTLLGRVTGGAALLYGLPHFVYHATHLGPYDTGDAVAMVVSLGFVVLAAALLIAPTPTSTSTPNVSGSRGRPAR
jgi:hypothetical protein